MDESVVNAVGAHMTSTLSSLNWWTKVATGTDGTLGL